MQKKLLAFLLVISFFGIGFSAWGANTTQTAPAKKYKFWKIKKKQPWPKMVETKEEWLNQAQNIDLQDRENPAKDPPVNKKLTVVQPPAPFLVKYNNPPGSPEADIALIKKEKMARSKGVANDDFTRMAYSQYNFYPNFNQISSEVFVMPLDTSKTIVERMTRANVLLADKSFTLTSAKYNYRRNLFSALTVLDWSKNGDVLLVKEKIGSLEGGIFRTNICVVFVDENVKTSAYKRFDNLEDTIKDYWAQKQGIRLNFYRWNIKPLGWNKENEDEIISLAHAWDKNGQEIFLGAWGLNYKTDAVRLISLSETRYEIAIYGNVISFKIR